MPGKVVAAAGHVHGHGIAVEATKAPQLNKHEATGQGEICRSTATPDPNNVHRILSMSTCTGDPVATVKQGEKVRLHSEYRSTHPADDVMGIMLAYIHRR